MRRLQTRPDRGSGAPENHKRGTPKNPLQLAEQECIRHHSEKKNTFQFGPLFLECCDFMIGSPTALANAEVESKLRSTAMTSGNGLYVPSGAFWGGEDVRKMADRGTLKVKNIFIPNRENELALQFALI